MPARRACTWGLSPLARGNQLRIQLVGALAGPIPARAGQPEMEHIEYTIAWAYPRSRGAT